ncbi:uncharacterized protein EI90DRAFT_3129657 [Cantharellus anzutake]|uniref:uncharacterized protein n=1 Tax=Cantharellus anzutake TaxID=1750568 RepID=UPI0019046A6F|nr:uncharacterized protein EI90DRAFT_3129657 [Cantharellus anzutake]KAF8324693.1 hypothetical protein EI90DRAFT_3129657 [Cantharellus anzutake]
MQTNFQLGGTPLGADEEDAQSEQFKPICVTVTLSVPKEGKKGKVARKPDTVQKQFQLDVLGSNNVVKPSVFWKSALEALGPTYVATYTPGDDSGQWPDFKWRKEGAAANKGLLVETNDEFSLMIQSIRDRMLLGIVVAVDLDSFQVMLQSTQMTPSHSAGGYGTGNKAPGATDLTPVEIERAEKVIKLQERWICTDPEHGGQYCYVHKVGDSCIPLSPYALKHWASSWLEGLASLDSPPNTQYFNQATHHRSKSQSQGPVNPPSNSVRGRLPGPHDPPLWSTVPGVTSPVQGTTYLATIHRKLPEISGSYMRPETRGRARGVQQPGAVTGAGASVGVDAVWARSGSVMSSLNLKPSVASPDKSPESPSPKKKADLPQPPSSPQKTGPILTHSLIEKFVSWCKVTRGEDWSACMNGMQSEEIYPDDYLGKLSNEELRNSLGLGLGSVKQYHMTFSDPTPSAQMNPAGPSSAKQKRKTPDDPNDWVVVPYKRKYPDGGEKRFHFRHFKDGHTPTYDDGILVFVRAHPPDPPPPGPTSPGSPSPTLHPSFIPLPPLSLSHFHFYFHFHSYFYFYFTQTTFPLYPWRNLVRARAAYTLGIPHGDTWVTVAVCGVTWRTSCDPSRMYINTPGVGTEEVTFFSTFPLQGSLSHIGAASMHARSTPREVLSTGRYAQTALTPDATLTVFNPPLSDNIDDMRDQYVEEQVKLHDEGVKDYVMVAEGGYWMQILLEEPCAMGGRTSFRTATFPHPSEELARTATFPR